LSSLSPEYAGAGAPVAFPPPGDAFAAVDPIEIYAAGIDTSDYVARVAPLVRQLVPQIGDLLDVGAGGGQLGRALRRPGHRWSAVEPNPAMQARLRRADATLVASGWETAAVAPAGHDTVLAATMPAQLADTRDFLARCRVWARRQVVWVVPAQNGPRGMCFAGNLPAEWHCEDETPGVDRVLRSLPDGAQPDAAMWTEWTFSALVGDLDALARYLADRLGWPATDPRRSAMAAHLALQLKRDPAGDRLETPRRSAVLVWRLA
jgi:hypothetical protein